MASRARRAHIDQHARYTITIEGHIDASLADCFGPLDVASVAQDGDRTISTLSSLVTDQAGLVGLIRHLHGLGVVLLSVERGSSQP
jgi:hypothetical protein